MKLAWIGTHNLGAHLENQGFEHVRIPLPLQSVLDWEDVCSLAGFEPDALVYSDRSLPPPLAGVERFPCLTCFYAVDTHIHSWYPFYAQFFDCCAVSLRDHLPWFQGSDQLGETIWLPPFPADKDRPQPEAAPEWDAVFVGKVDAETTPKRKAFLDEMERLAPGLVRVTRGSYAELFPRAKVVLNIAERGDLNFRVFEALACGACLLTPRIGHGQNEFFPPGECLEVYENLDAADAVGRLRELLADPDRRRGLAEAGHAEIERAHRRRHRVKSLAGLLRSEGASRACNDRLRNPGRFALELGAFYLHWAVHLKDEACRQKMVAAGLAAKQG